MSAVIDTLMGPVEVDGDQIAGEVSFPWTSPNNLLAFGMTAGLVVYALVTASYVWLLGPIAVVTLIALGLLRVNKMNDAGAIRRSEVTRIAPHRRPGYLVVTFERNNRAHTYYYVLSSSAARDAALETFKNLGYPVE